MEASYGKEPFDLRLTLLCLCRNLWKILAVTVLGTVLFGGGYYVKNVLLQPRSGYAASSTYKVEYLENPNAAGAYYINEATWNSLIHTGEFLDGVETHLQEASDRGENAAAEVLAMGRDRISNALSATLPSDFSIPVTKATLQDPEESVVLAGAVEETMCNEFAETIAEIRLIKVLDHANQAEAVVPDVRTLRAVILAAVVSCFLSVVVSFMWELSRDSIRLPATLRRRYGLNSLGTINSAGFVENVRYLLQKTENQRKLVTPEPTETESQRVSARQELTETESRHESVTLKLTVAVCGALPAVDPREVVVALEKKLPDVTYLAVPSPLLCPESAAALRKADVVLLAVPAGEYVGKQLEAVLEYLIPQDCPVTGAFLWNADEGLIRRYYFLPGGRQE